MSQQKAAAKRSIDISSNNIVNYSSEASLVAPSNDQCVQAYYRLGEETDERTSKILSYANEILLVAPIMIDEIETLRSDAVIRNDMDVGRVYELLLRIDDWHGLYAMTQDFINDFYSSLGDSEQLEACLQEGETNIAIYLRCQSDYSIVKSGLITPSISN